MGKKDMHFEKKPQLQSKAPVDESVIAALDMLDALSPEEILQINCNLQRSQAEMAEELWDMKWKFQALFEQSSIGIVYHEMIYDAAGTPLDARYLDANKTYIELIGIDPRGKTILQVFPECKTDAVHWMNTIHQTFKTVRFEQHWHLNDLWFECIAHQFKQGHFVNAF